MKFNAKDAGYWAAQIGESKYSNPYDEYSEEGVQWVEGFDRFKSDEALKHKTEDEGYRAAAQEGQGREENPYPKGSTANHYWNEGYHKWEAEEQAKDIEIMNMGGEPSA